MRWADADRTGSDTLLFAFAYATGTDGLTDDSFNKGAVIISFSRQRNTVMQWCHLNKSCSLSEQLCRRRRTYLERHSRCWRHRRRRRYPFFRSLSLAPYNPSKRNGTNGRIASITRNWRDAVCEMMMMMKRVKRVESE